MSQGTNDRRAGNLDGRVKPLHFAAFMALSVPLGMMQNSIIAILPSFYAKETQATLAAIGAILMITRIIDALLDPIAGAVSDRTNLKWGRRKPWILIGGILGIIAFYMLFTPESSNGAAYFAIWSILFYIAYTFMHIPYQAWAAELSRNYDERARIFGYVAFANILGLLIFNLTPIILSQLLPTRFPTAYFGADMLYAIAIMFGVVSIFAVSTTVFLVPDTGKCDINKSSVWELIESVRSNKPFLRFTAIYGFSGFGYGLYYGGAYIYLDSYLHVGDKFPLYLLVVAVTQALCMPIWVKLVYRFGKIPVWLTGWLIYSLILPTRLFMEPGPNTVYFIFILSFFGAATNASSSVVAPSVLGDVVDYDTLRSKENRAGNYYAFLTLIQKINVAVGGGLALLLLSAVGYDTKLTENTPAAIDGMLFIVCILPSVFFLIAAGFIYRFPIDRRKHGIIKKRIEQRVARLVQPAIL